MNAFLQNRFERWIAARHMPQKAGIVLDRRHVYILPSAHGVAYGVLMIILFLWSVNYNNSMGFALTFLLAAIALNAMWRCHNNLLDLRASALGAESPFAGQPARFGFVLEADDNQPRYDLEFRWPGEPATVCVDIPAGTVDLQVPKPTTQRGWLRPGRLRVDTTLSAGFVRAWSWLNFERQCLVYPQPQGARRLPKPGEANGANQTGGSVQGSEDFAGLQRYRAVIHATSYRLWRPVREPVNWRIYKSSALPHRKSRSCGWIGTAWLRQAPNPVCTSCVNGCCKLIKWVIAMDCDCRIRSSLWIRVLFIAKRVCGHYGLGVAALLAVSPQAENAGSASARTGLALAVAGLGASAGATYESFTAMAERVGYCSWLVARLECLAGQTIAWPLAALAAHAAGGRGVCFSVFPHAAQA
ncbi:MAG: hypothetical protein R3F53_16960 [Gammaproteobacteria bacterium]